MNTLIYFLTVSLYMIVLYGCYWLLLRRNTFFNLNRAYLLVSIICSLVLPFVELPVHAIVSSPMSRVTLPTVVVGSQPVAMSGGWSMEGILGLVYSLGVGFMLLRLSLRVVSVFRIIQRGAVEYRGSYSLVQLPDEEVNRIPSFSFGRYLVLNHSDGLTSLSALLRHEEAHIRQFHTVDILFVEVVSAFFWFNPVLGFYKNALQEVHEFLADRAAIHALFLTTTRSTESQPSYAQQLVAYALRVPVTALTTPFVSQTTLKQRLIMLQKPLTNRRALLHYTLVLPLVLCLLMCTQAEKESSINGSGSTANQTESRQVVKVDGEVFTVVEQQPEFPGGMAELGDYLQKNLRYPAAAQKVNAEGRVFISFIVTKTGEVTDVKILKDVGFGTGEEASRVVSQMPRWIPARQNGQLVNVRYNLPINFELDDKASEQ